MPRPDGPGAPPLIEGARSVDARGAQLGSLGDHNTVVVTFQQTRRVEWRVWFAAPVLGAAVLVWLLTTWTALGPTAAGLAAVATALLVLAGLTVREARRTRAEARRARDAALQPLELPELPPGVQSVSTLVAAERALAPLEGRQRERDRDALRDWCLDPAAPVVRIVDGPSGVGKTRLAVETGRVLPEGWVAGRCVPGRAVDVLPLVRACRDPTLVVVDDADTHPDLARLLDQLTAAPPVSPPVKVLLVVRDAAAFTGFLQAELRGAVAADWSVSTLSAIGEPSDRPRWFARAAAAYAAAAKRPVPPGLDTNRVRVGDPGEAMILTQVRAALTVLATDPTETARYRTAPVGDLVAALVRHEQQRWRAAAADPQRKLPDGLTAEALDDAMLALIALAPTTLDEAVKVLRRLPRLRGSKDDLPNVADWARHVYPGTTSGGAWADPAPDFVLGALLAHLAAPERADLVAALDLAKAARKRPAVLLRLVRAAAQFPSVAALLDDTVDRAPELVPAVVGHVLVVAAADPATRAVVIRLVAAHPIAAEEAQRLLDRMAGAQWNQLRVAMYRSLVHAARTALLDTDSDQTRGQLADALHTLSYGLSEVGQSRDALAAIEEAVELYRALARREPDRHTPDLARSLNSLGASLLRVGRRDEALACRGEAVARWADLAHRQPNDFREGYQRERAALARFCTDHAYPPGAALQAESDSARRLGFHGP